MGFLQEPPQHFLGIYMGFLSNFFKVRICKACYHWPSQQIIILFSLMECTLILFFFPVGHWTSWHCGGISVCSLLLFCLRALTGEVGASLEHHSVTRHRAGGLSISLCALWGGDSVKAAVLRGLFSGLASGFECHYLTITQDLISKSLFREI